MKAFKIKITSILFRSEIVVPIFHPRDESNVIGVLDADSELIGHYDETDKEYLIQICSLISEKYSDLAY
jgi:L-methionine (R)-S-oxide reductase